MLTCLFWNFNCHLEDKERIAARLALDTKANVLILAEIRTDPWRVLHELESSGQAFNIPPDLKEKYKDKEDVRFQIFTQFSAGELTLLREDGRVAVWRLVRPKMREILLVLIHFKSKRSYQGRNPFEGQHKDSESEYLTIHQAEDYVGHTRTIVMGDFNMNPFENGMIDPNGFGAMMSRELTERHSSPSMSGPGTRRFYNPVWSRMGRDLPHAPGTYYWNAVSDHLNIYWHYYDQVLIRPSLLAGFRDEDFTIVTSMPDDGGGTIDLIRAKEKHWEVKFSDHLPLLLKLDLPREQGHGESH